LKDRIHLEVRLSDAHGRVDPGTVLQEEEVTEERRLMPAEPALPVGGPDVLGAADRFLGAVVEVVAKAGTNL
jgi:hypothetical protein